MRAIKFRGKRITDGRWVYGGIAASPQKDSATIHTYDDDGYYARGYFVDPATIGQFTGLVDKNGREIYEGDFINYDGSTWGGVVQWHPNGYFFINDSYGKKYPRCESYRSLGDMLDGRPLVVVGNIHDNPELLEEKS